MSALLAFPAENQAEATTYRELSNTAVSGMSLPFSNPAVYPRQDIHGRWIAQMAVLPLSASGAQIIAESVTITETPEMLEARALAEILPGGAEYPEEDE